MSAQDPPQRIDLSRLWNAGNAALQNEFLSSLKATGLEALASQTQLLENGDLVPLRGYQAAPASATSAQSTAPATPADHPQEKRQYRKRKTGNDDEDIDLDQSRKRGKPVARGGDRGAKGLRHFSRQVCDKVQQRGVTTYNEVADELVADFIAQANEGEVTGEHKNIRRRVYDALNVLMAMRIIAKDKKEIKWLGLPPDAEDETVRLERLKGEAELRMQRKQTVLQELVSQHVMLVNLMARNSMPMYSSAEARIYLPFIIVQTSQETVIDCLMTEDRSEIHFDFSQPFEIHDDNEILRRMDLSLPTDVAVNSIPAEVHALLPPDAQPPLPGTPLSVQAEQGPVLAGNVTITSTPRRGSSAPQSPMRSYPIPGTPPVQTPPSNVNSLLMSPWQMSPATPQSIKPKRLMMPPATVQPTSGNI